MSDKTNIIRKEHLERTGKFTDSNISDIFDRINPFRCVLAPIEREEQMKNERGTKELERPNAHFFKSDVDIARKIGSIKTFRFSYQNFMRELFSYAINDKKFLEKFMKSRGVK